MVFEKGIISQNFARVRFTGLARLHRKSREICNLCRLKFATFSRKSMLETLTSLELSYNWHFFFIKVSCNLLMNVLSLMDSM